LAQLKLAAAGFIPAEKSPKILTIQPTTADLDRNGWLAVLTKSVSI